MAQSLLQVDESSAWVCPMHPDPAKADCKLKEERVTRAQFTSSDGFVALGQPGGQPSNLHFFRQLLAGYPELVEERHSALWWLAKQKPDAIAQGIQVTGPLRLQRSAHPTALRNRIPAWEIKQYCRAVCDAGRSTELSSTCPLVVHETRRYSCKAALQAGLESARVLLTVMAKL